MNAKLKQMSKTEIWSVAQAREFFAKGSKSTPYAGKKKNTGDKQKGEMQIVLQLLGFKHVPINKQGIYQADEFVTELVFSEERKFRFDWAIPAYKIGIEYEGLFSEKSGHTTIIGFVKDCDKYTLAAAEGWTVLRFTAKSYKTLTRRLNQTLLTKKQ
jgi:hypothetical protein